MDTGTLGLALYVVLTLGLSVLLHTRMKSFAMACFTTGMIATAILNFADVLWRGGVHRYFAITFVAGAIGAMATSAFVGAGVRIARRKRE